jgi:hypothetical protein
LDSLAKLIGGGYPITPDLSCDVHNDSIISNQLITEDPPSPDEALLEVFGGTLQAFIGREEPYTAMHVIPYTNNPPTIVTLSISSFAIVRPTHSPSAKSTPSLTTAS